MEAAALLGRIVLSAVRASMALEDERVGDFNRAVHALEADVLALADLVRSW